MVVEEKKVGSSVFYLVLCVILVVVLAACLVILARQFMRLSDQNLILRENLENLGRLNDKLRMDRHDYLNHLQIVYGLMELEEYDEMNSYLRKVYKELLKTGKAIRTSKPALNALLAAKNAEAEERGVEFIIEVKSDLKDLAIEDWELCKVLSNLIDNAMKALEDTERTDRKIEINITESPDRYIFEVENNGPAIPRDMLANIFKKGFSTKKEEGHGMGLSIVSEVLETNKGKICVSSDENETVFTVEFEKGA